MTNSPTPVSKREWQNGIRLGVLFHTTICELAARSGVGLIVMGTRGAGGVANLMLGNVATGVAREARCPVLVVR
jgi:universal stress protein family protein